MKYRIINFLGLIICFLPACIATLQYYPYIKEHTTSWLDRIGIGIIICAVIILTVIIKYGKSKFPSPTPATLFLSIWLICEALTSVVVPMRDIAFWGFVGSLVGGIIIKVSDYCERREARMKHE